MKTENLKQIITEEYTNQITKKRVSISKGIKKEFNSVKGQEGRNLVFHKTVQKDCEFLMNEFYEQKLIPQVGLFNVVGPYIYTFGSVSGEENTLTEQEKLILFIERVREHSDGEFMLYSDRIDSEKK